jgi:hypothetical protein
VISRDKAPMLTITKENAGRHQESNQLRWNEEGTARAEAFTSGTARLDEVPT